MSAYFSDHEVPAHCGLLESGRETRRPWIPDVWESRPGGGGV